MFFIETIYYFMLKQIYLISDIKFRIYFFILIFSSIKKFLILFVKFLIALINSKILSFISSYYLIK